MAPQANNGHTLHHHRRGDWIPKDHSRLCNWLDNLVHHVDKKHKDHHEKYSKPKPLHPALQEFEDYVNSNPQLLQLAEDTFKQVPNRPPYNKDPTGSPQVRDCHHMLQLVDEILSRAPAWDTHAEEVGAVGLPIGAILDRPMGTKAGYRFFLDPAVNKHLAKVLNTWGEFLASPDSAYVLTSEPHGWFSKEALSSLAEKANTGASNLTFDQIYTCSPDKPHYGYSSWDNFFTREFRDGVRPIACPDDDDVIINPCESKPVRLAHNVALDTEFNLKGQPYSLTDMLHGDPSAAQFEGGWVYQAFLSAMTYHRWHSPVSGTIVKTRVVPGTYYSESPHEGFSSEHGPDPEAPNNSQPYLAHVATRGLIWIQADNPNIGLTCVVQVGMSEVSSCDITVKPGQQVKKGDQIGMFHFGGSTYCLVLRPGVHVQWNLEVDEGEEASEHRESSIIPLKPASVNHRVNSWLAVVGESEAAAVQKANKLRGQN